MWSVVFIHSYRQRMIGQLYNIVRTDTRREGRWGLALRAQVPVLVLSCPEPYRPFQLSVLTHRSSIFHAQVVYAFFLAPRELHVVTIDPQPPSTPPTRDAVPTHRRTFHSSAQFESAVSAVSTNVPPSGRSRTASTNPLVPATRLRSELEGENRTDTLLHPPDIRPCAPSVPLVSISLPRSLDHSFIRYNE